MPHLQWLDFIADKEIAAILFEDGAVTPLANESWYTMGEHIPRLIEKGEQAVLSRCAVTLLAASRSSMSVLRYSNGYWHHFDGIEDEMKKMDNAAVDELVQRAYSFFIPGLWGTGRFDGHKYKREDFLKLRHFMTISDVWDDYERFVCPETVASAKEWEPPTVDVIFFETALFLLECLGLPKESSMTDVEARGPFRCLVCDDFDPTTEHVFLWKELVSKARI